MFVSVCFKLKQKRKFQEDRNLFCSLYYPESLELYLAYNWYSKDLE